MAQDGALAGHARAAGKNAGAAVVRSLAERLPATPPTRAADAPGAAAWHPQGDPHRPDGARRPRIAPVDLRAFPPDQRLIDQLGALFCQRHQLVPLRAAGAVTFIAMARPADFPHLRDGLTRALGPVAVVAAAAPAIDDALLHRRGSRLAHAAETQTPAHESCRDRFDPSFSMLTLATGALVLALLIAAPVAFLLTLLGIALAGMVATTCLKVLAARKTLGGRAMPPPIDIAHLPTVSIIVALHRESRILPLLIQRLSRLDYPRDLLEICLAVEAGDDETRRALDRITLPDWMRVAVVPRGRIKTKPRALNHALDHCRGSIIGVLDAEDAPEPDQVRRIVQRFYSQGPRLACVQGMLDYYNPLTNWLSRSFTLEYATWFRVVLPGMERLKLILPLGGTTLYFRRAALERLGSWDAHNVTEDADLGVRLFRHGFRTEILDTVTFEEANCRLLPWIRQRSRWIKGYMMTWLVHMRAPVRLWREVGPRAFLGLQVTFLVSSLQWLLAPVLWLFWIAPRSITGIPDGFFLTMTAICIATLIVEGVLAFIALRRSGHRMSPLWIIGLYGYFMLATLAAYKALWELVWRPFYWDKTSHGHFSAEPAPAPA